jgi:hypothetical protein
MDEWQRMTNYSESRLEDLQAQARAAQLVGRKPFAWGRLIAVTTAVLLGMLIWWIR